MLLERLLGTHVARLQLADLGVEGGLGALVDGRDRGHQRRVRLLAPRLHRLHDVLGREAAHLALDRAVRASEATHTKERTHKPTHYIRL